MSFIASKCMISKRTLYESFESKLDLFTELAIQHRNNIVNIDEDPEDQPLEGALFRLFRLDRSDAELSRQAAEIRLFFVEASANPELGQLLKKHCGADLHRQISAWTARQAECGRLVTASPDNTAKLILDILIGAQVFRPHPVDERVALADMRTYLRDTIRSLAQGLAPR